MPRRKVTTIQQVQATNEQEEKQKKSRQANGEASVRKRDDGRFEARVSLSHGERKSVYGKTRKEVLAKVRELQQQVAQGSYVPSSRETVANYLRYWLNIKRLKWGEGTYVTQRTNVERHLIPAFGDTLLQQLTVEQIQLFYVNLQAQKHLENSTIQSIHGTLNSALGHAVKERKIVVNPMSTVIVPKREKKERRYLTTQEIERVIEVAHRHQHGCLFLLAVVAGMRRNELLALKWEDINLEQGALQVKRALSIIM